MEPKAAALVVGDEPGCFAFVGDMSFKTVPALYEAASVIMKSNDDIEINLSGVERADSAGLALLIELATQAKRKKRSIEFLNIPYQMLDIARVSRLDTVLEIYREG